MAHPRPPITVRFYFCFRSPYTWFAAHRIGRALAGLPVRVDYIPNWEPGTDLQVALAERHLVGYYSLWHPFKRRYMFQDVRRLARHYGLPLVWPRDPRDADWALPHIAYLYAGDRGRGRQLFAAAFAARFERGEDVTAPAVVRRLGGACGLDPDDLLEAARDGRYEGRIIQLFTRAIEDQVFGWPFFVLGRQRFWGHDRLEMLAAAIRELECRSLARLGRESA